MDGLETTSQSETLIAPHEVRELVARLSQATVESRTVDDSGTLEGLAVSTGIPVARLREELDAMRGRRKSVLPALGSVAACMAILGATYFAWPRPKPQVAPTQPPVLAPVDIKKAGLVQLTDVTYGPDRGSVLVDPSFEPTKPLPEGVSVSAQTGEVLWGAGDHRARAIQQSLSDADTVALKAGLAELLEYARERASKRGLPTSKGLMGVGTPYSGEGYSFMVSILTYYGACGSQVQLPVPGVDEADAKRAIRQGVDKAVEQLQHQLKTFERMHEDQGPR